MSKGKTILRRTLAGLALLVLAVVALGVGTALKSLQKAKGEHSGGSGSVTSAITDLGQLVTDPRAGFPGQDRVNILCMGLDDNWTDKDEVYTTGSRTDTLFLLSLDLDSKKVSMLSIPRDTYTHIAGTRDRYFKINEAFETGGPQRSIDTVAELLGVRADHYLVLNIDSTRKMVDALGGVDVDVPHEMHYHDKWGHLSIDLMPGLQHLDGDQAIGFARYRHPDAGMKPTVEDGDDRRMARQHILLRAMVDRAKSFANVTQAPHLMDVGMSTIRTDMSRAQLLDLAMIFRGVQPEDIQTASLTGDDFRGPHGEWFYRLDMVKAKAYTDWLIRGDDQAARRLVPVVVLNGTTMPGLADRVVRQLKTYGYTDVRNGGNAAPPAPKVELTDSPAGTTPAPPGSYAHSRLVDTGVAYPQAAQDVASLVGLTDAVPVHQHLKPNKMGWTPDPTLTVTLGQDYAQAVKDSGVLNTAQAPPDVPNAATDN